MIKVQNVFEFLQYKYDNAWWLQSYCISDKGKGNSIKCP